MASATIPPFSPGVGTGRGSSSSATTGLENGHAHNVDFLEKGQEQIVTEAIDPFLVRILLSSSHTPFKASCETQLTNFPGYI